MIDLHCHLLPGIDDGATDLAISLEMARQYVADGVTHAVCTPHIMPGVWANTGPQIREAVAALQAALDEAGIELTVLAGADNHVVPDFVAGLNDGRLLTLADTRFVLVEPPHNVAPPRLDELFFSIAVAGYVPILTHPERLTWIEGHYDLVKRLIDGGTLMQLTAGSLAGRFSKRVQALALRMLRDGHVHILATDAHDPERRPPLLSEGWQIACDELGAEAAERLVLTTPFAILKNEAVTTITDHVLSTRSARDGSRSLRVGNAYGPRCELSAHQTHNTGSVSGGGWLARRLRRLTE